MAGFEPDRFRFFGLTRRRRLDASADFTCQKYKKKQETF
jgi:hypothetical protein